MTNTVTPQTIFKKPQKFHPFRSYETAVAGSVMNLKLFTTECTLVHDFSTNCFIRNEANISQFKS